MKRRFVMAFTIVAGFLTIVSSFTSCTGQGVAAPAPAGQALPILAG